MSYPTPGLRHAPLYNSRIINTYIKLLRNKYPHVDIDYLLSYARMKPYEVADPGHWFSQEQVDLFHEHLVQVTGNEYISREAGRYAASPEVLGHIRHWTMGLLDPATVFTFISQIIPQFTRSTVYRSQKLLPNKVEITVTPKEDVEEKRFQCENRIGYFEAVIRMFKCAQPKIEHPECIFEGGTCCRYIVSWQQPFFVLWKRAKKYIFMASSLSFLLSLLINPAITLKFIIPIFLAFFLF